MISKCTFVVAIGQIPPPVTGLSYITSRMIELLKQSHPVETANIAAGPDAKGLSKHIRRMLRVLGAAAILIRHATKLDRVCYLVCEGDWGVIYMIFLAFFARICGYPIFLHHHSFAYIDRPRALLRALLHAGGPSLTHVFLCETMRAKFAAAYSVNSSRVVSNAAFVGPQPRRDVRAGPITIGLLSNLTREKGLHTFLELFRQLLAENASARAVLAGPIVNEPDRKLIDAACSEFAGALDYRGPLYGSLKDKFYEDIDAFVFPTEYTHEAEPTVLFEALSSGAIVVAFDRGCIASQIGANGQIIPLAADFIQGSLEYLRQAATELTQLRTQRHARMQGYQQLHSSSSTVAARLFSDQT